MVHGSESKIRLGGKSKSIFLEIDLPMSKFLPVIGSNTDVIFQRTEKTSGEQMDGHGLKQETVSANNIESLKEAYD